MLDVGLLSRTYNAMETGKFLNRVYVLVIVHAMGDSTSRQLGLQDCWCRKSHTVKIFLKKH